MITLAHVIITLIGAIAAWAFVYAMGSKP